MILLALTLFAACSKPKIIPDSRLADIFYEAFLTNAYIGEKRLRLDSLKVYEPIFERYGYTIEDVQYTFGNFSKRKSARLGDVVEVAIDRLESEGEWYNREVRILDTIDARARRAFSRVIYLDTLVEVNRLRDTSRLLIKIDSLLPGEYEVSFDYFIDSLDKNRGQRVIIELERNDGVRRSIFNNTMRSREEVSVSRTVKNEGDENSIYINLAKFQKDKKVERPRMKFNNIVVRYIPFAESVIDSLYDRSIDLGVFNHELIAQPDPVAPDSLASAAVAQ